MSPNSIDELVHLNMQIMLHLSPPYVVPYVLAEFPFQTNLVNTLGYVLYVMQSQLFFVVHCYYQSCHLCEDLPVK